MLGHPLIGADHRFLMVTDRLPHGQWLPWVDREFGWTDETVRKFMRVAQMIGKSQPDWNLSSSSIDASSLYLLAAPEVPVEARAAAFVTVRMMRSMQLANQAPLIGAARPGKGSAAADHGRLDWCRINRRPGYEPPGRAARLDVQPPCIAELARFLAIGEHTAGGFWCFDPAAIAKLAATGLVKRTVRSGAACGRW